MLCEKRDWFNLLRSILQDILTVATGKGFRDELTYSPGVGKW